MTFNGGIYDILFAGKRYLEIIQKKVEGMEENKEILEKIDKKLKSIETILSHPATPKIKGMENRELVSVLSSTNIYFLPDGRYIPFFDFLLKVENEETLKKLGKILNTNSYVLIENNKAKFIKSIS